MHDSMCPNTSVCARVYTHVQLLPHPTIHEHNCESHAHIPAISRVMSDVPIYSTP